jgi:hypothetical protein
LLDQLSHISNYFPQNAPNAQNFYCSGFPMLCFEFTENGVFDAIPLRGFFLHDAKGSIFGGVSV